jgi:hypothetical protein
MSSVTKFSPHDVGSRFIAKVAVAVLQPRIEVEPPPTAPSPSPNSRRGSDSWPRLFRAGRGHTGGPCRLRGSVTFCLFGTAFKRNDSRYGL